jgi:hypothetical protein
MFSRVEERTIGARTRLPSSIFTHERLAVVRARGANSSPLKAAALQRWERLGSGGMLPNSALNPHFITNCKIVARRRDLNARGPQKMRF